MQILSGRPAGAGWTSEMTDSTRLSSHDVKYRKRASCCSHLTHSIVVIPPSAMSHQNLRWRGGSTSFSIVHYQATQFEQTHSPSIDIE